MHSKTPESRVDNRGLSIPLHEVEMPRGPEKSGPLGISASQYTGQDRLHRPGLTRLPFFDGIAVPTPSSYRSAANAIVQVGDTLSPLEDPGALQFDVLGIEVLEETAALAEEHRDEMDLELVEDAGGERELRGCGAVDQHVLLARGPPGLRHRGLDVAHVGDERPSLDVDAR